MKPTVYLDTTIPSIDFQINESRITSLQGMLSVGSVENYLAEKLYFFDERENLKLHIDATRQWWADKGFPFKAGHRHSGLTVLGVPV